MAGILAFDLLSARLEDVGASGTLRRVIRSSAHHDGAVAVLTVDRPEKRNALDLDHCVALHEALDVVVTAGARAVVVTGSGTAFCSGADLGGVYGSTFRDALYGMLYRFCTVPVPVIAAVNGPAIGAGTQLAIACDLRVCDTSARFGVPTAKLGLAVDPWTIRRLALLAGGGAARRMLLGCDEIELDDAERAGLVDRRGTLVDAIGWASTVAGLAPLTLAYNKLALDRLGEPGPRPLDDPELVTAFESCWASEDFVEGQAASREKRPPRFRGR